MPPEAHAGSVAGGTPVSAPAATDRSTRRTGLIHAIGPLIIMFAGPTLMDILGLAQISPYPWPPLVTAVQAGSTLVGAGWLLSLAVRHPAPDLRRWYEVGLYAVLAVECCVGIVLRHRDGGAALFELVRAVLVLALIARLAYLRSGAVRDLAPGEDWRRRSTARGWILTAAIMVIAMVATITTARAAWSWFGANAVSSEVGTLHDWALVLCSAPIEELVSVAAVVSALEYAGRPAWQIYAVTITARIAYHLHYGLPAAFALAILAAASTWTYRRWRQVTPLIVPHLAWDLTLTIAALI